MTHRPEASPQKVWVLMNWHVVWKERWQSQLLTAVCQAWLQTNDTDAVPRIGIAKKQPSGNQVSQAKRGRTGRPEVWGVGVRWHPALFEPARRRQPDRPPPVFQADTQGPKHIWPRRFDKECI